LDELDRMAAIAEQALAGTPEPAFDRLTQLAARVFQVPMAFLAVGGGGGYALRSRLGVPEAARDAVLLEATVHSPDLVVVNDAAADPRFRADTLVVGPPAVRFFAGAPLLGPGGACVGALAVLDVVPRSLTAAERRLLSDLAAVAMDEITLRALVRAPQAERLASMGTLAAGVAHEINNPLTYVMANIGFVSERLAKMGRELGGGAERGGLSADRLPLGPQIEELRLALTEAQEGAVRVRQIVRDLKVFARGADERYAPIDVRPVIESAISMAWSEIRPRARLVKKLVEVPAVEASESRLGQVFLNLLVNAAQAIDEGDAASNEIRVETGVDTRGQVVISVADTGVGISPSIIGRIFDPFFTTKPIGIGTGLGLFICHGIVKALGGELVVESQQGQGACFRVVLPAAAVPAGVGETAAAVELGPRLRLLFIDDEARVAQGLERALAARHDVVIAGGAREALKVLERDDRFDVIVCDLMMPEVTGMDLYAELERSRPELVRRVVFMTGGALTARAREFLGRVPNPRLEKPFDLERLRAIIAGLVAN
jgi:signal transduction histidine kinase